MEPAGIVSSALYMETLKLISLLFHRSYNTVTNLVKISQFFPMFIIEQVFRWLSEMMNEQFGIKTSESHYRWLPCPAYGNGVVRSAMKNLLPNGHNCFKGWYCCVFIFFALQVTQSFLLPSTWATVQRCQLSLLVHWSAEVTLSPQGTCPQVDPLID